MHAECFDLFDSEFYGVDCRMGGWLAGCYFRPSSTAPLKQSIFMEFLIALGRGRDPSIYHNRPCHACVCVWVFRGHTQKDDYFIVIDNHPPPRPRRNTNTVLHLNFIICGLLIRGRSGWAGWMVVEHVAVVKGVCSAVNHVSRASASSALNTYYIGHK